VRAVLDTNVVVSALLWDGTPERLIEAAGEGRLELTTSEALLAELAGILTRSKFAERLRHKNLSAAEIMASYQAVAEKITVTSATHTLLRDPDDAPVLDCASAAGADLIVSGDRDLLVLKAHHGMPIVNASEALRIVSKS
jgi:uncharacterized protein